MNINRDFSLPAKTIYIESSREINEDDFVIAEQKIIGKLPFGMAEFDNTTTGIDTFRKYSPLHNRERLSHPIYSISECVLEGAKYYAVSILPLTVDSSENLVFTGEIHSNIGVKEKSILGALPLAQKESMLNDSGASDGANSAAGVPLNCKFIIITSPQLAGSFKPMVDFKKIIGISTAVALTDSIYAHYSGIDKAEQIRNYLEDFYASGGRYVLLGGDDDIVPPRYLFYYNVDFVPTDTNDLMPSDLYYADMDGDWDKDGDGVWGEPTHDSPDLIPELKVGRIPVRTSQAVANYCSKLIAYCSNPGNGDYEYLTKGLFFSADEMRDYPTGGSIRRYRAFIHTVSI